MFKNFDLTALRRDKRIAFYFRYPLYHGEFQELRENGKLLGRFSAKPLYGRLTEQGRVDKSAGFNGQVAVVFIPARARSAESAKLYLTRMPRKDVALPNGRRNWPAIRAAAKRAVKNKLAQQVRRRGKSRRRGN